MIAIGTEIGTAIATMVAAAAAAPAAAALATRLAEAVPLAVVVWGEAPRDRRKTAALKDLERPGWISQEKECSPEPNQ
jgi:hypothetical protein